MPWVIAIMMFLTLLAAAAGLGLGQAAATLDSGNRITIQVVQADEARREAETAVVLLFLRHSMPEASVRRVPQDELQQMLEPWLGPSGMGEQLPVPAMIEADLSERDWRRIEQVRTAIARLAPSARVDENARWLAPVGKLIAALRWLAAALVLLMAAAMTATVVLAARAALDTHRPTIEVLHLMGATDGQIAALFQRRIALDSLFGSLLGAATAAFVLLLLDRRLDALGSELIGSSDLPPLGWLLLVTLPILSVILAMVVARLTVLRALVRLL